MASGLSWLGGKTWAQVTREERFFCAELFFAIRRDVDRFVNFLVDEKLPIQTGLNWEPAYETCFYRDIEHHRYHCGGDKPEGEFSRKRTFDLTLFSSEETVLIEAKAHEGFERSQLCELKRDRRKVERWTGCKKVHLVGLASSIYRPRCSTVDSFDLMIRWSDLARWYSADDHAKRVFCRADRIYKDYDKR